MTPLDTANAIIAQQADEMKVMSDKLAAETARADYNQFRREQNLDDWEVMQAERNAWRVCAERLRVFAISYRSHPRRNPDDLLDDALAEFDRLKR